MKVSHLKVLADPGPDAGFSVERRLFLPMIVARALHDEEQRNEVQQGKEAVSSKRGLSEGEDNMARDSDKLTAKLYRRALLIGNAAIVANGGRCR